MELYVQFFKHFVLAFDLIHHLLFLWHVILITKLQYCQM